MHAVPLAYFRYYIAFLVLVGILYTRSIEREKARIVYFYF